MNQQIIKRALARKRGVFVVASLLAGSAAQTVSAADYIWTRGGGNNNWDTALNWTPGAPNVTPVAGDTTNIIYAGTPIAASTTSAMRQAYTIDSLRFASDFTPNTPPATFNLSTQSTLLAGATNANLTIGAGGITSDVTTFNITITKNNAVPEASLIVSADQTWATNAPAASAGAITFTVNRVVSGPGRITKSGTGVLVVGNTLAND